MALPNARIRRLLIACLAMALLLVTLTKRHFIKPKFRRSPLPVTAKHASPEKGVVMAKTRSDDVQWALDLSPDWQSYIYTTSIPPEPGYLIPPEQQDRNSVIHLTFIIDFYDALPDYSAFVHATPDRSHDEILTIPIPETLTQLDLATAASHGFVKLCCNREPGCPDGVNPLKPLSSNVASSLSYTSFTNIYAELFNISRTDVPKIISSPSCKQFVVSREGIRARPLTDYIRMRRWALDANDTDNFTVDRFFERVWHILFGMSPVLCPAAETCQCDLYGRCGDEMQHSDGPAAGVHPGLKS